MDTESAVQYLEGLLGRQLRIHTTDTRMFVGVFKCTDAVSRPGEGSSLLLDLDFYELC